MTATGTADCYGEVAPVLSLESGQPFPDQLLDIAYELSHLVETLQVMLDCRIHARQVS